MITTNIIGTGRVAQTLFGLMEANTSISVLGVLGRSRDSLGDWSRGKGIADPAQLRPAMVHIIAVSDSSIAEVAQQLKHLSGLLVHTSGTTSIEKLRPHGRIGVFYPLQTFSLDAPAQPDQIPWIIDAQHQEDLSLLTALAEELGSSATHLNDLKRKEMHLAAVMINNFTHHIWSMTQAWVAQSSGDFALLHPLAKKTLDIALQDSTGHQQTGPARRNDRSTLEQHLALLGDHPLAQIYQTMTESIVQRHEKEL